MLPSELLTLKPRQRPVPITENGISHSNREVSSQCPVCPAPESSLQSAMYSVFKCLSGKTETDNSNNNMAPGTLLGSKESKLNVGGTRTCGQPISKKGHTEGQHVVTPYSQISIKIGDGGPV